MNESHFPEEGEVDAVALRDAGDVMGYDRKGEPVPATVPNGNSDAGDIAVDNKVPVSEADAKPVVPEPLAVTMPLPEPDCATDAVPLR